jgi:hypothetical protein
MVERRDIKSPSTTGQSVSSPFYLLPRRVTPQEDKEEGKTVFLERQRSRTKCSRVAGVLGGDTNFRDMGDATFFGARLGCSSSPSSNCCTVGLCCSSSRDTSPTPAAQGVSRTSALASSSSAPASTSSSASPPSCPSSCSCVCSPSVCRDQEKPQG